MFSWSNSEKIVLPIALIIVLVAAFLISFLLRKRDEKIKRIPLMILTVITLVLEIVKQILGIINGYNLWNIPLHFCSLFLYFYPLASFFKGKVREFGSTMCIVSATLFLLLFYTNPSSIISSSCDNIFESFSTFHTFIYHHIILLFYFLLIFSQLYRPSTRDYIYNLIGIGGYALVAIPTAHLLNVNFCSLLKSVIPFMETLRLNAGQVVYTFVMICVGVLGGELVVLLANLIHNKAKNKEDSFEKIMCVIKGGV